MIILDGGIFIPLSQTVMNFLRHLSLLTIKRQSVSLNGLHQGLNGLHQGLYGLHQGLNGLHQGLNGLHQGLFGPVRLGPC